MRVHDALLTLRRLFLWLFLESEFDASVEALQQVLQTNTNEPLETAALTTLRRGLDRFGTHLTEITQPAPVVNTHQLDRLTPLVPSLLRGLAHQGSSVAPSPRMVHRPVLWGANRLSDCCVRLPNRNHSHGRVA